MGKSREIPTLQWIKDGLIKVLRKYGHPEYGYRMKPRCSKKSCIRSDFAEINRKALKPTRLGKKNFSIKQLILEFDDVIRVDDTSEPDGVWVLYLRDESLYYLN